jgi:hypothetical protein
MPPDIYRASGGAQAILRPVPQAVHDLAPVNDAGVAQESIEPL